MSGDLKRLMAGGEGETELNDLGNNWHILMELLLLGECLYFLEFSAKQRRENIN